MNIYDRWNKTGILKGIKSPEVKKVTASALENQRLFNEENWNSLSTAFRRITVPLVRKVIPFVDGIQIMELKTPSIVVETPIYFEEFTPESMRNSAFGNNAEGEQIGNIAIEVIGWLGQHRNLHFKAFGIKGNKLTIHGVIKEEICKI